MCGRSFKNLFKSKSLIGAFSYLEVFGVISIPGWYEHSVHANPDSMLRLFTVGP